MAQPPVDVEAEPADDDTQPGHSRLRRAVVPLAALAALLTGMFAAALAATTTTELTAVAPETGYTAVNVTFSAEPRAAADKNKPLGAGAFALSGTSVTVTSATTSTADPKTYRLVLSGAVTPNATSVVVPAGAAVLSDGTAVPRLERVVPLLAADATRAAQALSTVELDGRPFSPVPFVGSWFANLEEVAADASGMAALQDAAGVEPAADADSATRQLESRPLALTDLLTGLDAALTKVAAAGSQQAVVAALQGVPGIGTVTFTGTELRVALDPDEVAGEHAADQRTAVPALPYVVDGSTAFDLRLAGSLTFDLTASGAALDAVDLELRPRDLVLPEQARIGMVGVEADSAVTTDVALTLDCTGGCPDGAVPGATGGVDLAVDEVTYDDADGATTVDLTTSDGSLGVAWSPGDWDVPGLAAIEDETTDDAQALLDDLAPVVTGRGPWDDAELAQFDALDARSVPLALEWVGNWLRSTDAVEAFGTSLPGVGMTVGDVLELSDQVGGSVTRLVEALEPDGTTADPVDPSAQELLAVLCAQDLVDCPDGADALPGLAIGTDTITYDVELDVCTVLFGASGDCDEAGAIPVSEAGPALDLSVGDEDGPLGGIRASLRTGTWEGTARATLALRLRLDLRPDDEVKTALGGIEPEDYPGPGYAAESLLVPGDVCRGLALALGVTATPFAGANDVLADGQPTPACDRLAWDDAGALRSVQVPGADGAAATSRTVTTTDVCTAVALKNGLQLDQLLSLNPGLGTGDAALTACAARAYAHVTTTGDTARAALTKFVFHVPSDALPVSYRLAVEPLGDAPFVEAAVAVTGADLGGEVVLGFLDLALSGEVSAEPTVQVDLLGDEPLTLVDLAEAADETTPATDTEAPTNAVGELLDATLGGELAVDLQLANDVAFASGPAEFRLQGSLDDLVDGVTTTGCDELGDGDTGLCYDLGEWTDLAELTPAQVLRMVTGLVDRLAGLAGTGDAAFELPLIGASMSDLVGFTGKLRSFADTVEGRDPQSLTALQDAVDAALAGAGLPAGTVVVGIEDDVFTLQLPLGVSEEASYPFGFDVGFGEGGPLPVRIAPADGGARVVAAGSASFAPTLGIDLGAAVADLDDAVFLVVDEEDDPTLSGSIDASIAGDVTFGPLTTDFSGTATADASLSLQLSSLPGEDDGDRLTLSRLTELLDPESDEALPEDFLQWSGELGVDASITGPIGPIELAWTGELADLVSGGTGEFSELPSVDDVLALKLDLATLVRGTSQTTRFVGRALAESDALSTSLPLVGDQLAALSAVGEDLQTFATTVDDLYAQVEENDEEFVADINATLNAEVCGVLGAAGDCVAELVLFTDGEKQDEPDVTTADGVELRLQLSKEETLTLDTPKILDVPDFEVDTAAALEVTAGYRLGLTLGLDVERGFYVQGFDVGEEDLTRLLELYGRASIVGGGDGGGVKIGGVTAFTLDELDMGLGGTLGPDGDGAGFALDMPEPLTLVDVVNGRRSVDEIFEPKISVDVGAQLTIGTPDGGGSIPALAFPVWFAWQAEGVVGGGLELESPSLSVGNAEEDSYVTIDVTSLVNDVVRPALIELNKYNPVAQAAPVKDALNSEIPVLDQNVRTMLDSALGSDPRWQLFSFLLDLDEVATSLVDESPATEVLIPLGGYTVLPAEDAGYFSPAEDGEAYTVWDDPSLGFIKDLVQKLSAAAGGAKSFTKPTPVVPPKPGTWDGDLRGSSTTSYSGTVPKKPALKQVVTMPILDNPLSAATLLFGGEVEPVSFIEIAPPAVDFGMSVKFERTLFDLDLGAIEARLAVGLEGAVGVVLRVGVGYSSHGLTSGDPVNGLYLVDAYDGNRDLPMVALGGRVSARVDGRFAVAGIAEANFNGSGYVRLEGGLDLFDESLVVPEAGRGDGMFHVDEMLRVVDGHRIGSTKDDVADFFCIFRPTVQLEAGLAFGASAEVLGIEVWSGSFSDEWLLVDEAWSCPYVERVAQLVERRVVLAAGPAAAERLDDEGDVGEAFTVTQSGDSITVSGAGDFAGYRAMTFPLEAVDEVYADLGEGDDTVDVDPSVTVPVQLFGGPGNDVLKGGGGDDVLDGGTGTDRVETRGGDDEVVVGAEAEEPAGRLAAESAPDLTAGEGLGACADDACNVVVLGGGDDTVTGGPAPVVYRTEAGAWGADRITHTGRTMVLDLGGSAAGVDGVVDALGLHVTSPDGSIDTGDPSVLARLLGSAGDDRLRIADGPVGMYVDGAAGADVVTVETNGDDRTARVHDTGPDVDCAPADEATCGDRLVVRGTAAADRFLLRAHVSGSAVDGPDRSPDAAVPADVGVVAVLSPESGTDAEPTTAPDAVADLRYTGRADATQLVFYDDTLEALKVQGVAGEDEYALDDVATVTTVEGGRGSGAGTVGSRFQVGQLFGWLTDEIVTPTDDTAAYRRPTSPDHPVEPWAVDQFRYRESIRGWLSYGISNPTTVRGGLSDDRYTVYSNRAQLQLEGVGGDDTFTLRSFIANGTIKAAGGDGDDTFNYDFEYVANNAVDIDGGTGFNTFVAIGTELQDGFTVTQDGVTVCRPDDEAPGVSDLDERVRREPGIAALPLQPDPAAPVGAAGDCAVNSSAERVQRYVLYGLQGNDVFWVRGAPAKSETYLVGGRDGSTYLVGDDGDLSAVDGTVQVAADLDNLSASAAAALAAVDLEFPVPVLLAGDVTHSPVDALLPADAVDLGAESTLVVDGSTTTSALEGTLEREGDSPESGVRLSGLTASGGTFELEELDAAGEPRTYELAGGIGAQGLDTFRLLLGEGADDLRVTGTVGPYGTAAATAAAADAPTALPRDGRTELHTGGGADSVQVDALDGPTWAWLEDGDDALRAGTGTATGIRHPLEVYGGAGADDVEVDASDLDRPALRADLDLVGAYQPSWSGAPAQDVLLLTGLEMPGLVRHDAEVDVFRVRTGPQADVVNVLGTLAGTSTALETAAGDDRVFVTRNAQPQQLGAAVPGLLTGSLADVRHDVDLDAGTGQNLLMVSDRDSAIGRTVTMTADSLGVAGLGTVGYTATGGTFAQGVTSWFGAQGDVVTVTGVRADGADPGVMAWDVPTAGAVRTLTTLLTGGGADTVTASAPAGDGTLVLQLEEGDDTLAGQASGNRLAVFGGDGADGLSTGSGDDVVFGDWGRVEYGRAGAPEAVLGVPDRMDLVPRASRAPAVVASCTAQATVTGTALTGTALSGCEPTTRPAVTAVRDYGLPAKVRNWVSVGAGDDVAVGGGGSDWVDAAAGRNALVADHGAVRRVAPAALGGRADITTNDGFLTVTVLEEAFAYDIGVRDDLGGSPDVVLGGSARDWVFSGLGDDLVNGQGGSDLLLGGDGSDALWGGLGDDRVLAGYGNDLVDVKPTAPGSWAISWWKGAPLVRASGWTGLLATADTDLLRATDNGSDVVFGGDGQDALQADVGGAGPVPGDRLLDWYGGHNVYFVCDGAYGAGYVLRNPSPATVTALQRIARADGAAGPAGERQLAIPVSGNRSPVHPAHPGNNLGC